MKYNFKHINNDNEKCMCKSCRFDRALNKETIEEVMKKRIERARQIVIDRIKEESNGKI